MKSFIGTSGWTYDAWKGTFYPQKLAKNKWFGYYTEKFQCVEINATYYRGFKESTYHKWYQRSPAHFQYVLKAPQAITHRKFLKNCGLIIERFVSSALILEEKLGGILLQLHPNTQYNPGLLNEVLQQFNLPGKIDVEFRDEKWFTKEVKHVLQENKAATVNCQSPKFTKLDWITHEIAYFRFHGRNEWYKHDYSDKELNEFAEIIKKLPEQGVKQVFVFFNNDYDAHAPKNALKLMRLLKE